MDHWSAETFGKARGPPTDSQLNNRPGNGFNQTHGRYQEGHEGDQQDACLRFRVKGKDWVRACGLETIRTSSAAVIKKWRW